MDTTYPSRSVYQLPHYALYFTSRWPPPPAGNPPVKYSAPTMPKCKGNNWINSLNVYALHSSFIYLALSPQSLGETLSNDRKHLQIQAQSLGAYTWWVLSEHLTLTRCGSLFLQPWHQHDRPHLPVSTDLNEVVYNTASMLMHTKNKTSEKTSSDVWGHGHLGSDGTLILALVHSLIYYTHSLAHQILNTSGDNWIWQHNMVSRDLVRPLCSLFTSLCQSLVLSLMLYGSQMCIFKTVQYSKDTGVYNERLNQ